MGGFASVGFDYRDEKTQTINKGSIATTYSLGLY